MSYERTKALSVVEVSTVTKELMKIAARALENNDKDMLAIVLARIDRLENLPDPQEAWMNIMNRKQ